MCGIFGFSGPQKADLNKIKVLALYNLERGPDSAGIFINGDTFKTIKTIKELLAENELEYTQDNDYTVIGHTRKSSSGAVNINNAHPFLYENDQKEVAAFVHNGTLWDWRIDMKNYIQTNQFAVDSHALGAVVLANKYDYLKDYSGAATYLLVRPGGILEVWKGASKFGTELEEDRPLFGLRTEEGLYVSSLEESLKAIAVGDQVPFKFTFNHILRYKNGELIEQVSIDRDTYRRTYSSYNTQNRFSGKNTAPGKTNVDGGTVSKKKKKASEKKEENGCFLWSKTIEYNANIHRSAVYYDRGRYYSNGHLMHSFTEDGKVSKTYLDSDYLVTGESFKKTEHIFYRGLLLHANIPAVAESRFHQLEMIFRNAKISEYFNINNASKIISTLVDGVFAFLPNELLSPHYARFGIYKDGRNLVLQEKGYVFTAKFDRKVKVLISTQTRKVYIQDHDGSEKARISLSAIVNEPFEEQLQYLELSKGQLLDLVGRDNVDVVDKFFKLTQIREPYHDSTKKSKNPFSDDMLDDDLIDEKDLAITELNVEGYKEDIQPLKADLNLLLDRLDSGFYGPIDTEAVEVSILELLAILEEDVVIMDVV